MVNNKLTSSRKALINKEDVKYAGWIVVSPRADDDAEGVGRSAMVVELECGSTRRGLRSPHPVRYHVRTTHGKMLLRPL